MRKLSTILLPVAAIGALIASSLAVSATPAAADPWGYGYGYRYARYERPEHFDRFRRFDRYERFDRYRHEDRGWYGHRYGDYRYGGYERWR